MVAIAGGDADEMDAVRGGRLRGVLLMRPAFAARLAQDAQRPAPVGDFDAVTAPGRAGEVPAPKRRGSDAHVPPRRLIAWVETGGAAVPFERFLPVFLPLVEQAEVMRRHRPARIGRCGLFEELQGL